MRLGDHAVSRRQVLGLGAALAAAPLLRPSAAHSAGFDWMQQKGKSLVVLVSLSPYYTVLQKMVPDFTKLTGIQVEYQVVPEQHREREGARCMQERDGGEKPQELTARAFVWSHRRQPRGDDTGRRPAEEQSAGSKVPLVACHS